MKRTLTWSLLALGFIVFGAVATVLLRSDSSGMPPPDPAMLIHLADGTARPLSEVLDAVYQGLPLPVSPPAVTADAPLAPGETLTDAQLADRQRVIEDIRRALENQFHGEEGSIFRLAEDARREGRLDEAAALYLSIPEDDDRYARSRRRLAWDVLTKGQGQPRRAVLYAHEALAADPFNGNSWQDLARVYGATLGFEMD